MVDNKTDDGFTIVDADTFKNIRDEAIARGLDVDEWSDADTNSTRLTFEDEKYQTVIGAMAQKPKNVVKLVQPQPVPIQVPPYDFTGPPREVSDERYKLAMRILQAKENKTPLFKDPEVFRFIMEALYR